MATIQTVVDQVQSYLRAAYVAPVGNGLLRAAPDNPQDAMLVFPCAITYPAAGQYNWDSYRVKRGLHTLVVEVHWAKRDLTKENEMMSPFIEHIPNLLMTKMIDDNKWNGTIDNFGAEGQSAITYQTGNLGIWGDVAHFGIRFMIHDIKIRSSIG
jgi:hypothetical protein